MGEASCSTLAGTVLLASLGMGALFPDLDLAALVGASGSAFSMSSSLEPWGYTVGWISFRHLDPWLSRRCRRYWSGLDPDDEAGSVRLFYGFHCFTARPDWTETGAPPHLLRWMLNIHLAKGSDPWPQSSRQRLPGHLHHDQFRVPAP